MKILNIKLVILIIFVFVGWKMYCEENLKEVDEFYAESGAGYAILKWKINNTDNIIGFEITARGETITYKKSNIIPVDKREYKFENLEPLDNVSFRIRTLLKDGERSKGISTKIMIKHKNIVYDEFMGKKMFIYLPDGYYESDEKYPTMYMFDGQNIFSKAYVSYEWNVDEVLDRLIKENKIRKVMVVGIFHAGEKRTEEYTAYEYEKGKEFAENLAKKFTKFIEEKYKALPGRENRGIMGSSRGGLMALYMINNYSDYFSFCGAVSPSEKWKFRDYKDFEKKDVKIWIDNGTADYVLGYSRSEACRIMVDGYLSQGHKYGESLVFYEVKDSIHNEIDWAKRVEYPFIMFVGKDKGEIIDFKLDLEVFHNLEMKPVIAVNPVADFTNGMRYSLYNMPKYSITGKAKISDRGIVEMNGEKECVVTVEYKGIKKNLTIKSDDIEKMIIANRGAM